MDEAKAISNVCRIFHRKEDGKNSILGCGCVVKCSDGSLKIATSKKIRKWTSGEVFAKFDAIKDEEFKLHVDKEETEGQERGIAYVSFDETAFGQRTEGILMKDLGRTGEIEEVACCVPVLENLEQLGRSGTCETKLYSVVRDQSTCTLRIQTGTNHRDINSLRDGDKFHLVVLGAPILDDKFEFLGIVDFVKVDQESLLELVYDRIQSTPTVPHNQPTTHPEPTTPRETRPRETDAEVNIKCVSTGPLWLSVNANLVNNYGKNDFEQLKVLVQEAVLPAGAYVREINIESVTFVVRVTYLSALNELWKRYKEGKMKQDFAEKIFDISEMKAHEANVDQTTDLIIEMSEDEYMKAKDQLTISQQTPVDPEGTMPTLSVITNGKKTIGNARQPQEDQQETANSDRNKLTPADPLQKIWSYIDFRDRFSSVLNVKYNLLSRAKYWPHLAEQFGIDWAIYDSFSTSDIKSPTETLLEYLEATDPNYTVGDFCKDCKEVDVYEVHYIVKESVKDCILDNEDLVSEICDKAPRVLDNIVLKLDREPRLLQDIARIRKISRKTYMTFNSDRTTNPARLFFDVLQMQGPEITVGDFKEKSKNLKPDPPKQILKILEDYRISDEILLRDISQKSPVAKSAIESFLNKPKTEFLWYLADLYQKEGLMEDIDVQLVFRHKEEVLDPTLRVMEYVLSSQPTKYTIEDLIIKLWKIRRKDCFDILQPYLLRGRDDIDKITNGLERCQSDRSDGGREPSTSDERAASASIPASDEQKNLYVMTKTN